MALTVCEFTDLVEQGFRHTRVKEGGHFFRIALLEPAWFYGNEPVCLVNALGAALVGKFGGPEAASAELQKLPFSLTTYEGDDDHRVLFYRSAALLLDVPEHAARCIELLPPDISIQDIIKRLRELGMEWDVMFL
jgi:hypothetical protein